MKYILILILSFCSVAKAQSHGPYAFDSYYRLKNWSYDLADMLYLQNQTIKLPQASKNISVFFGNDDYSGEINKSIVQAFKGLMDSNCIDYISLCEFKNSGNKMSKRFSNGHSITIEFFVPTSGQEGQTQNLFLSKLQSSDQIYYIGHSRYGKGPDFYPISQNRSLKVESIIEKLNSRKAAINSVGLISCSSQGHFGEELISKAKYQRLILTNQSIPIATAEKTLFTLLNLEIGGSSLRNWSNHIVIK